MHREAAAAEIGTLTQRLAQTQRVLHQTTKDYILGEGFEILSQPPYELKPKPKPYTMRRSLSGWRRHSVCCSKRPKTTFSVRALRSCHNRVKPIH